MTNGKMSQKLISSLIKNDAKVLDVGCGNGNLLTFLENEKKINGHGLEISPQGVQECLAKGLSVLQGNADTDLTNFPENSFDYVILSQTLQAMYNPKIVLHELLRIGAKAIVSFPNFGHWKVRLQLLLTGRMPVTEGLPYTWYETPNIHFFTLKDFQDMCSNSNIYIERSIGLTSRGKQFEITNNSLLANLITNEAIFLLSNKNFEPIKIKPKQKVLSTSAIIAN